MATQITATTPRIRATLRLGALGLAVLAAIAVTVIGFGIWSQAGSVRDVTNQGQAYGVGYPLHGGLAGPSRIGPRATVAAPSARVSAAVLANHYGSGYPLHGGLAGPSRPLQVVDPAGHYGPGYPLHGGLAGPGLVDGGD